jgi:hypothetical protein
MVQMWKNHMTDAIWLHVPTTRAPALHLQYHDVMDTSSYVIHKLCVLLEIWWIDYIQDTSQHVAIDGSDTDPEE